MRYPLDSFEEGFVILGMTVGFLAYGIFLVITLAYFGETMRRRFGGIFMFISAAILCGTTFLNIPADCFFGQQIC